jgi:hypothetical protein
VLQHHQMLQLQMCRQLLVVLQLGLLLLLPSRHRGALVGSLEA